jgi:hypothetical protein
VTTDSELKRSRGGRLDDARPARRNAVTCAARRRHCTETCRRKNEGIDACVQQLLAFNLRASAAVAKNLIHSLSLLQ